MGFELSETQLIYRDMVRSFTENEVNSGGFFLLGNP
jgi:hypothetical protein